VVWLITGALTIIGALSCGELAAMMPKAGGWYVYLREAYSPLWGFLFGWTLFLVIQTGTIAAVAVAFARFLGVLMPGVSPNQWIIHPINVSSGYAISLSTQQLVAILVIILLTMVNTRGLQLGKLIQNVFTSAKTLALAALIVIGIFIGRNSDVLHANFTNFWSPTNVTDIKSDLSSVPTVSALTAFGLFIAVCVAQVGSLFSADAWFSVTYIAGEVKNPKRTIPLSLLLGAGLVITLYVLANVAYLCVLPLDKIQHAPDDRVGTAVMATIFHGAGAAIMAGAILISTFGCINGLILSGARVYYAMARDGLFFQDAGKLNACHVPAIGLALQGVWAVLLVLPRTRIVDAAGAPVLNAAGQPTYGNLYGNLLDYVISVELIFYALAVAAVFVLRRKQPNAERPYRAFGYPLLPALYIIGTLTIMFVLFAYRTQTSWPGLIILLTGLPVYFLWRWRSAGKPAS
jgi:APA family basic amino acid/polyamine antiporter